jgi:uncharacterized phage-associated protein
METNDSSNGDPAEIPFDIQRLLESLALTSEEKGSESDRPADVGTSPVERKIYKTPVRRVSALDVAEYVLRKLGRMSTMKLQKLVYYSQAWSLVWDEAPLFDEHIQAWANGPVIRELFNYHRGMFEIAHVLTGNPELMSQTQRETVDAVLDFYGSKPAQWLIDLSHSEEPWQKARRGLPETARGTRTISLDSMADYYSSLSDE